MLRSKTLMGKVLLCICEILVGILLLIDPVSFTTSIITGLGLLLFAVGAIVIFGYFRMPPDEARLNQGLVKGLCAVLSGMFCIFHSGWFIAAFPLLTIIYGVSILLIGIVRVQWAVDLFRVKRRRWPLATISAIITVAAAAVILLNPFASTALLWMFTGIALLAEAVADLVVLVIMRGKGEIIF